MAAPLTPAEPPVAAGVNICVPTDVIRFPAPRPTQGKAPPKADEARQAPEGDE